MPKVIVSMVTYNATGYLPFALPSLAALDNKEGELIIIDNASTDQSSEYIKNAGYDCTLIESPTNRGFGAGHNEVIRKTSSEYVLVFNQDMVIEPDYIKECVSFMDAHPEVGSVTGILQRARWDKQGNLEKTESIDTCGIRIKKSHNAKDITQVVSWEKPFEIFGPSGACALYRRSALEDVAYREGDSIEYFDEDFFMYKEDIDLAYRLRWQGWRSYAIPTARAYHFRTKGQKFVRNNKQVNYWSYRNHIYLIIKNVSKGMLPSCLPTMTAYEIAKIGYILLREWSTLRGLKDVWRLRNRMTKKRVSIMRTRRMSDTEMLSLLQ